MRYSLTEAECRNLEISSRREWLLTNGIGGYAMGTPSGINTRRYHGLLVAATEPPAGRTVLLAEIEAIAYVNGEEFAQSTHQYPGLIHPDGYSRLLEFSSGDSIVWRWEAGSAIVEREVVMHQGHNAITVVYRNLGDTEIKLSLRPLVCHKTYHANFRRSADYPEKLVVEHDRVLIAHGGVELLLALSGFGAATNPLSSPGERGQGVRGSIRELGDWYKNFEHVREIDRGLDPYDDLFCPVELSKTLAAGTGVSLSASCGDPQGWSRLSCRNDDQTLQRQLKAATSYFVIETPDRASIIAGYPWFADWGRDTMISLPGLCLCAGRIELAKRILRDYASHMANGLIPNRFTESGGAEYNSVDATLWFANAVYETMQAEWDEEFASEMCSALRDCYAHFTTGTFYGIRVDPIDGLVTQGEEGIQLTWMDAKGGGVPVTPRYGKAVEINALWVNLLRVIEWAQSRLCEPAQYSIPVAPEMCELAETSFRSKFFDESLGHYLDTIEPRDHSLRPNQLIAMSLPFGPAIGADAKRALEIVTEELLTPRGLRTLGPREPAYRGRFEGPLPALDAAYHQGTVWPWLLGPYVSALMRINGDREGAQAALSGVPDMLREYGLGGIAEVYDGDEPHRPNGCPWQAWSVAELLRVSALVAVDSQS